MDKEQKIAYYIFVIIMIVIFAYHFAINYKKNNYIDSDIMKPISKNYVLC